MSESNTRESIDADPDGAGSSGRLRSGSGGIGTRRLLVAIVVGLLLVVGGTGVGNWATTSSGDVDVRETTIETESGLELSATVYEPVGASPDDPAPAALLIHGYTGHRGTMSSFATELADRGYVAVTVDQPGHGGSDPPAFADGWGGPASLEYTRSLETVDESRVALAGHSMGGFASLAAAEAHPDGYQSLTLIGSTWGFSGAPGANETFPRNMAVVYAPYDEFSPAMWNESVPGDVNEGDKMAGAFPTASAIEPGTTYGSIEDGTARTYTAPPTIHSGMHRSTTAVGDTVEWIERTTGGAEEPSVDDQRWYWASIGHALALLGGLVVGVGVTALVWRRTGDTAGRATRADRDAESRVARSTTLGLSALPALTIYPLYAIGTVVVPTTRLTHQQLTHGYVLWIAGTIALAAGIVRWRHGGVDRASLRALRPDRSTAGRALLAAVAGSGALYAIAAVADAVAGGALDAWMIGFSPLSALRWISLAVYVLPITAAAVAFAAGLESVVGVGVGGSKSLPRALGRALAVTCGGLVVFLAVQYVPLFLGYGMPVPSAGPLAITAITATGTLVVATVVATATTRLTDSSLTGGVLTGLLVTWLIVATSPIHVAPL
ncbi:alpha/beta hydrolase [Natrinema salaciae]|uniref:Alpha/beta hydrolase family protein n=1 Tax=Natrinema salaciae TaxID=1186196 RepID=A0A1H9FSN5_9EURY|nr:alpha/beta fold hydrolase [Natrinema salaciae]SEQ40866.1 Alpha/beta hydrolase family protein [Natrinema salaciae]